MKNAIKISLAFILGAAAGAAVSWKLLKTKYERIADEEIASVKEVYHKRCQENDGLLESLNNELKRHCGISKDDVSEEIEDYELRLEDLGYHNKINEKGGNPMNKSTPFVYPENDRNKPFVIPPDEFGENDCYDTLSIVYYADGILEESETGSMLTDPNGTIGLESLEHFGEWEDDSVFVQNDRMKCYFEILKDERKYSEVNPRDDE